MHNSIANSDNLKLLHLLLNGGPFQYFSSALINLGYSKNEAEAAVLKAHQKMAPPITLETLVRLSLQEFQVRYG